MDKNKPVYNFLGYQMVLVDYKRVKNTNIEKFSIKTYDRKFDEKINCFSFNVQLELKYSEEEASKFIFSVGFRINDLEWKKQIKEEGIIESIFFATVFPYIREKIYSVTNDSRGAFNIPIIDLRNAKLNQGATFTFKKLENKH